MSHPEARRPASHGNVTVTVPGVLCHMLQAVSRHCRDDTRDHGHDVAVTKVMMSHLTTVSVA